MRQSSRNGWVRCAAVCCVIGSWATTLASDGGWLEQSLVLHEGWNLFWLEVQPAPHDPATVFADVAGELESIWQFLPGTIPDSTGAWLVYDPSAPGYVNTLSLIQGQRAYFIKLSADPAKPLTIIGRPVPREHGLSEVTGTHIGASVNNPTSFADYFDFLNDTDEIIHLTRFDPAVGDQGDFVAVDLNGGDGLDAGVGYWLKTSQPIPYSGPVRVSGPPDGCQFGTDGYIDTLTIEIPQVPDDGDDETDSSEVVNVKVLASAPPPVSEPADAGVGSSDWLQYRACDEKGICEWLVFGSDGVNLEVAEGQALAEIELRGDRASVDDATVDEHNALYQALIEVSDQHGHKLVLAAGMEKLPIWGTWIGQVRLDEVSLHEDVENSPEGTEAAKTMSFSIIVEIPEGGDATLLDQACVTVTRDGEPMDLLFRPILFPDPIALTGSPEEQLSGTMTLDADHPLNPYKHRTNPKHRLGYTLERVITMNMTNEPDPDRDQDPLFDFLDDTIGNNNLVGDYTEVIRGLLDDLDDPEETTIQEITVRGRFSLQRLSEQTGLRFCSEEGRP